MSYKSFETERLLLTPITGEDAEFIIELFNSPGWLMYIGDRNIRTIDEARAYIRTRITPQLERLGFSAYVVYGKVEKRKLGICGLYDREGIEGIDLGFALLSEYEGKGYAYEAAECLKKAAFSEFCLPELVAITSIDNFRSQKLLKKLGFTMTGTVTLPNDSEKLLLYCLAFDSTPGSA